MSVRARILLISSADASVCLFSSSLSRNSANIARPSGKNRTETKHVPLALAIGPPEVSQSRSPSAPLPWAGRAIGNVLLAESATHSVSGGIPASSARGNVAARTTPTDSRAGLFGNSHMLPTLSRRLERKNMTHAVAFSRFASVFSDDCLTTKPSGRSNETFVVPILMAFGVPRRLLLGRAATRSGSLARLLSYSRGLLSAGSPIRIHRCGRG